MPAFQLLDAVAKGTLDGGHGVVAYHYGKNSALALWGSGPSFGMDPNMLLSWHYYGGGKALLDEIYKSMNVDVVSYLYGPMPTQPLRLVQEADRQGRGHQGHQVPHGRPGGRHVHRHGRRGEPAAGRRDRAGAGPRPDRRRRVQQRRRRDKLLGFPDVVKNCMLQSFHQSGEQFEILFNKAKYDALPAELKSIIDYAVQAVQRRHELEGHRSATRRTTSS